MLNLSSARSIHGRQSNRGLTLIELVVVLALLGIALVAALPSISSWMRNLQLRSSAESIRAGVERARMEALRRNTQMGFWLVNDSAGALTANCALSTSGPAWVVSIEDPSSKCGVAPSASVSPRAVDGWAPGPSANTVQVAAIDAAGDSASSAVFNSLGQLQAGGIVRIDVTDANGQATALRIMVSSSGSVRMCTPSAPSGDPRQC